MPKPFFAFRQHINLLGLLFSHDYFNFSLLAEAHSYVYAIGGGVFYLVWLIPSTPNFYEYNLVLWMLAENSYIDAEHRASCELTKREIDSDNNFVIT